MGEAGISRTRLKPDTARSKFDTTRVDASKADFSDRLHAQKHSYIVSSRRRTKARPYEDLSDEDDTDEGLARRIARLNREIDEVRSALQRRDQERSDGVAEEPPTDSDAVSASPQEADITSLTRALDSIQTSQRQALSAHARFASQLARPFVPISNDTTLAYTTPAQAAEQVDTTTLSKLATFDTRLAALEAALGPNDPSSPSGPILPTLSLLDSQLALLTSPSAVPDLQAKLSALLALNAATTVPPTDDDNEENDDDADKKITSHDLAQLRSLYATLPALTSLAPTVPPLLERLRGLRHLHADAAGAKGMADELERRQAETERELAAWREGIAAVEKAVVRAEEGFKVNVGEVEGWVRRLEEQLQETNST